jgi:hypothetical protein
VGRTRSLSLLLLGAVFEEGKLAIVSRMRCILPEIENNYKPKKMRNEQ